MRVNGSRNEKTFMESGFARREAHGGNGSPVDRFSPHGCHTGEDRRRYPHMWAGLGPDRCRYLRGFGVDAGAGG